MNITTEKKDRLLQYIADNSYEVDCFFDKELSSIGTIDELDIIISQLKNLGLVSEYSNVDTSSGLIHIKPTAELFDFIQQGGFKAMGLIAQAEIEKLSFAVEKLSKETKDIGKVEIPSVLSGLSSIGNIVSNLINIFRNAQ
ncbi:hypothetical protein [Phocaeicola sp.]